MRFGVCSRLVRLGVVRKAMAVVLTIASLGYAVAGGPMAGAADACPDVELVFARGTGEPPGPGRVGQALADTLAPMLGGRSLAVYGVNYPPASTFSPPPRVPPIPRFTWRPRP